MSNEEMKRPPGHQTIIHSGLTYGRDITRLARLLLPSSLESVDIYMYFSFSIFDIADGHCLHSHCLQSSPPFVYSPLVASVPSAPPNRSLLSAPP